MNQTIFYESPMGPVRLESSGGSLAALQFVQTKKQGTIEEDIVYSSPCSSFLTDVVRQLDDYFAGRKLSFALQLAQPGTVFQQKVWRELCKIKPGATLSYLQLSKNLGDPRAIRAVGTANGKNNIAIIVPCHRVIGTDGRLVGYAGDLWRKQWLLAHEAKFCNGVMSLF